MRKLKGNIAQIRELEDCIRATKRYTEGLFTKKIEHSQQGDSPSRAFTRLLEVYLDHDFMGIDWDRDAVEFIKDGLDWYASRATVVKFWYDYRSNKAEISFDWDILVNICNIMPNFANALAVILPDFSLEKEKEKVVMTNAVSRVSR